MDELLLTELIVTDQIHVVSFYRIKPVEISGGFEPLYRITANSGEVDLALGIKRRTQNLGYYI